MMSDSEPLVFYDIASRYQPLSYAPNPSKTRYALGFKKVPFKTTFLDILDIAPTRQELGVAAGRKLDDGSDFFTLPMLQDPSSGKVIGDSFDIANYLEDKYPDPGDGQLFPSNSTGFGLDYESPNKDTVFFAPLTNIVGAKHDEYAKFNRHVDATFTSNMVLYGYNMPFNPPSADEVKALMCKRAHLSSWEDLKIESEAREALKAVMKQNLASLAELYLAREGPFLEGDMVSYADLIVGAWLNCYSTIMPGDEWEVFRTWYDGAFARLHDVLQEKYFVSGLDAKE